MSTQGAEPPVPAGSHEPAQGSRRWRLIVVGVVLLLVVGVTVLELWEEAPSWLHGARHGVVTALHWIREHWLTSGALGVIATLAALGVQRYWALQGTRSVKEGERGALLRANCWVDETTGWLPRVGQAIDPLTLGIHPAAEIEDVKAADQAVNLPGGMPVYVPRDKDDELDEKLARGGLVLLVGDSTAGKSRAAYEAIHRLFGQRFLLVPHARGSIRALVDGGIELRKVVVWLNDLERWLGSNGLDAGLLRRLLGDGRRQVVVAATMRASEYAARATKLEPGRSDATAELRRVEREVLDQAARIDLDRRFSGRERERAQQCAWDPRIADALAHAGTYGLAEYIAAGPRLWQRWRDGLSVDNPPEQLAGTAIVAAAVDCRRAGLTRPVSEELLRDLHLGYLATLVARRVGPKAFRAGLEWAIDPIQATSALLVQAKDGYLAFDYLVDRLQADPLAPPVPDATWTRLLADLDVQDAMAVGGVAYRAGRLEFAAQAFRKAAETGDHVVETFLGALLIMQGRREEGEQWWRKAAEAGNHNAETALGRLLAQQGRHEDAEPWLRKAAEAGHQDAESTLGALLAEQGRGDQTGE